MCILWNYHLNRVIPSYCWNFHKQQCIIIGVDCNSKHLRFIILMNNNRISYLSSFAMWGQKAHGRASYPLTAVKTVKYIIFENGTFFKNSDNLAVVKPTKEETNITSTYRNIFAYLSSNYDSCFSLVILACYILCLFWKWVHSNSIRQAKNVFINNQNLAFHFLKKSYNGFQCHLCN